MKKNPLLLRQGVFSLNAIIFAEISVEVPSTANLLPHYKKI